MDSFAAQAQLAVALRRLAERILCCPTEVTHLHDLTTAIESLAETFDGIDPLPKNERYGGRNRAQTFIETGRWPGPADDGSVLEFDIASVVGGALHPFSMGVEYRRDGDEAVGSVVVGPAFEGPPGRVHGGVVCAIFDETMGSVFRATGTASAFTGELAVRFVAPAPLGERLEFRARERLAEGRKRFLEATGVGPDGVFATATATFIEMQRQDIESSVL